MRVCPRCNFAFDTDTDSQLCPHAELQPGDRLNKMTTTPLRIRELFHLVWTKAVGQPRYDKKEWQELRQLLYDEYGVYL